MRFPYHFEIKSAPFFPKFKLMVKSKSSLQEPEGRQFKTCTWINHFKTAYKNVKVLTGIYLRGHFTARRFHADHFSAPTFPRVHIFLQPHSSAVPQLYATYKRLHISAHLYRMTLFC